jgi:hypothetical protein
MCNGVNGDAPDSLSRKANALMSCPATIELFDAIRFTQLTVGWLSLNSSHPKNQNLQFLVDFCVLVTYRPRTKYD